MRAELAARARDLAYLLTSWPSVTGSAGEVAFPQLLAGRMSHVGKVSIIPIADDPFGRSNILMVKRGKSKRTVVLTGHFDTVDFADYGALADLALEPNRLTPALLAHYGQDYPLLRADLESGVFIPGRGLLDMKAGLAAGLAVMEIHRGEATLVFLGVADEEERSAGARAAVSTLRQLALEEKLDIALVVNLDSISDQKDGANGRVVAFGSIGKQLLCAYVMGKAAHAGYPQDGVNPAYIMAELLRAMELAPELGEQSGSESAPPPTALYAKDGKTGYNVTTPSDAFAYWNTMQHRRSGAEVLDIAMGIAKRAIAEAEHRTGETINLVRASDIAGEIAMPDQSLSLPDQCLMAFRQLSKSLPSPSVIVGFGSIPYPAVLMRNDTLKARIAKAVAPFGIAAVNYFAGISDMSFFGEATGNLAVVAANTPVWGKSFMMPEPGGWPCINLGPWGRDYHTPFERVHGPYAFEILPKALLAVIDATTKAD